MRETTNYGLKITEGNDDWRDVFDDNADNMETIDEAMADGAGKAGRELLGYKENGNTASRTIAIGKFVVWKGNLYKAKVAIPQGTAFSTSNLTAVGDGGFNELQTKIGDVGNTDLQSQVTSLNSKLAPKYPSATISDKCGTGSVVNCFIVGRILFVYGYVISASGMSANDIIATIEDGYFAYVAKRVWTGVITTDGTAVSVKLDNETQKVLRANSAIASGKDFHFFLAAPVD